MQAHFFGSVNSSSPEEGHSQWSAIAEPSSLGVRVRVSD